MTNKKTKCDFCRYKTSSGCMVTPNSHYCREATDEYYRYLNGSQSFRPTKSLRSWDKKR